LSAIFWVDDVVHADKFPRMISFARDEDLNVMTYINYEDLLSRFTLALSV
jgi:hypothetical protein